MSMDTIGRRMAWLTAALLVVAVAGCEEGVGPETVISIPFEFERDATGQAGFHVIGVNGDIEVTGVTHGETVRVTGFRRVDNCRRSEAERWIDELEVSVTVSAGEIIIQTLQPQDTGPCSLVVHYDVVVPRRLAGRILNVNGSVTVEGLDGGLSATDVNGSVTVRDVADNTTVRLTNGSILAELEIDGSDRIDLLTVNGAIDLAIPAGTSAMLNASVVNGTIAVRDLTVTNSVTTPTSLTGRLGAGAGEITLRTTNGSITVTGT